MKRKKTIIVSALVSFILAVSFTQAFGQRSLQGAVGLPLGSLDRGLTTSVAFYGGCSQGSFSGIVIDRMIRETTRIKIQEQSGTSRGRIIYDGPVSVGQFIPFTKSTIIWTGWKSGYGNHMNGVWVRGVCQ